MSQDHTKTLTALRDLVQLLNYVGELKPILRKALLSSMLLALSGLAIIRIEAYIIGSILPLNDSYSTFMFIFFLFSLATFDILFGLFFRMNNSLLVNACSSNIRIKLQRCVEAMSTKADSLKSGEVFNRITFSVEQLEKCLEQFLNSVIMGIVRIGLIFLLFLTISPGLTTILFLLSAAIGFAPGLMGRLIAKKNMTQIKAQNSFSSTLQEILHNAESLKLTRASSYALNRTSRAFQTYQEISSQIKFLWALIHAGGRSLRLLSYLAIIWFGTFLITQENLDLSTLLTVFLIFRTSLDLFLSIVEFFQYKLPYSQVQKSLIDAILAHENQALTNSAPARKASSLDLDIQNLTFSYPDKAEVFRDVSISIGSHGFVALVGPSGSGKSTLIHLLLKELRASSGSILLGGIPIQDWPMDDLHRHISYIDQFPRIFNLSLVDNIVLGDVVSQDRLQAALEKASISDLPQHLIHGLDTILGEEIDLSEGQKQRICLARAFYRDKDLFLLDEPTRALDGSNKKRIISALKELSSSKLILSSTHDLELIQEADRIIFLDGNGAVASGTHSQLIANNVSYQLSYKSDFT